MIFDSLNCAISTLYWRGRRIDLDIRSCWSDLDDFNALPPHEARRRLAGRLQAQIRHFAARADALPEWREAAQIKDPDDLWAAWTSLPILTKQDLRDRFRPDEMQRRFKLDGVASSTGGSTGEPTPFFHDSAMRTAKYAAQLYCQRQFGWEPGMPVVQVWGSDRDIGKHGRTLKARLEARLLNQWMVDGYRLSADTTDRVMKLISRFRSVALYGFTGLLEFVAGQVLERGAVSSLRGRVHAAWNGGEMLFDQQVELFQSAFGVPLLNLYGGRELSAMAFQQRAGGPLRVLRPLLFVEIVDDLGKPVRPGETGRLIWTSTVCRGTPFLRYDIGDIGSSDDHDQDESGIRALTSLQGRHAGMLKLANGNAIGCLYWNHLFKEYPEIKQFQVALIGDHRIQLRLKGSGFDRDREGQLLAVVKKLVNQNDVTVTWLDCIPLTPQGKRVQVIHEPVESS